MSFTVTTKAGPELVRHIGKECSFLYNGKQRSGTLDAVGKEAFVVEVADAESQYKSFRYDRVENHGEINVW